MRLPIVSALHLLLVAGCFSPNEASETAASLTSTGDSESVGDTTGAGGGPTGGTVATSAGTTAGTGSSSSGAEDPGSETTGDGSSVSDTEDTGVTETTTTSGDAETAGPACVDDCVVLPEGWNGPVTLSEGEVPTACQDASEPEFVGFSGLNAPPATCGCDCGNPDVVCPDTGTVSNRGTPNQAACFTFVSPIWTSDVGPGCNDIPDVLDPAAELRLVVDGPGDVGGSSCSPFATSDVPPATWSTAWTGCAADASVDGCDLCLTEAEDLCIWSEGDVACNVVGFPEKTLIFDDIADGRECTECSCGDPTGSCDATVTYRASNTCGLANVGSGQDGDCIDVEFARGAALAFETNFSCSPAAVSAVGAAAGAGPTTVCCGG